MLSNIEAKIDFPDEDLPKDILAEIKKKSEKIQKEIKKTLNDQKVGERIREGFKIAIVGPTNVGKSIFLSNIATTAASEGKNVLVVSLEMSEMIYCKRITSTFWYI